MICIALILSSSLGLGLRTPLTAQPVESGLPAEQGEYHWTFGFSLFTYEVGPSDLVYPDFGVHRPPAAGMRFGRVLDVNSTLGFLIDGELLLGWVNREVEGTFAEMGGQLTGFQLHMGPIWRFGAVALYGGVGLNRVAIGGARSCCIDAGFDIYYYGNGGESALWAKSLNSLDDGSPDGTITIPDYSSTSFGVLAGASVRLFRVSGAEGLRLGIDYVPVVRESLRHNLRLTLSVSG